MVEAMKPLSVAPVGADEQAGAARLLRRFSDQDLTFTDAVGLHVMQARKLRTCWSTDFHLGLTGVPLVIDEH
jgi:predicted nucleic acid-binding protein